MTSKIKIRKARKTDIPIIAQHNQALANETENIKLNNQTILSGVSKALDREDCHYFVAEYNGEVAGQIMITHEWSDWRNGLFWWIQSVYVVPAARRSGVFTALYQYVKKMAQDDNAACGLRLYMEKDNLPARAVYMAMGMDTTPYQVFEDLF